MQYASALLGLSAFGLMLLLFYWPWQQWCTDWARQIVFESRDEVFDLARSGKLDFNSNEYKTIRTSLERLIRFAHELTIFKYAILMSATRGDAISELSRATSSISDDVTRARVRELVANAHVAMVKMLAMKSLILLFVLAAACLVEPLRRWIKPHTIGLQEAIQVEAESARLVSP